MGCGNGCGCGGCTNIKVINNQGERGETGSIGATGADGATGDTGATGADGTLAPLVWVPFVLVNSWAVAANDTPEYALSNGLVYFRGQLDATSATNVAFTNTAIAGFTGTRFSAIGAVGASAVAWSSVVFNSGAGTIEIVDHASFSTWGLDTIPTESAR